MDEKTIIAIKARGIIMIPTEGNNDLIAVKNEYFFILTLDAVADGPILLSTAVANRG
ncbi:hypothetical protein [Serratia sp. UGAL515B_01]|uniref:hypothetical protein n=1 Tax=Serratia sp. UGAL515B_01 TaxID=2986763 RepID=UPI0029556D55|nr:hypothetical protein [Serratia sp. UGAL515B_01]WON77622.1 hypothetical protein OK023_02650 [Serratia sp. UGAL515B_01]